MKFKKNSEGKIILKDREGNDVGFRHPVDVREALDKIDDDGEKRYTLPRSSIMSLSEEVTENKAMKNIEKKIRFDRLKNKGIRTTSGEIISSEHLIDEDDEDSVRIDSGIDNLEGEEDDVLDEMGFEDSGEDEADPVIEDNKPRGRGRRSSRGE